MNIVIKIKNKIVEDKKMKTRILTLASVIIFLIANNSFAEGKEVGKNESSKSAAPSIEVVVEDVLEIADWMIEENCFGDVELEEALTIENWMTSEIASFDTFEIEEEEELEIEDWMTEVFVDTEEIEEEEELEIEDWMSEVWNVNNLTNSTAKK